MLLLLLFPSPSLHLAVITSEKREADEEWRSVKPETAPAAVARWDDGSAATDRKRRISFFFYSSLLLFSLSLYLSECDLLRMQQRDDEKLPFHVKKRKLDC